MRAIKRFFQGAASLPRGAWFFLRNPSLWPTGVVPILLTMFVFTVALIGVFLGVDALVDRLEDIAAPLRPEAADAGFWKAIGHFFVMVWFGIRSAGHWVLTHLRWLFFILAAGIFAFLSFFAFVVVVNIIGAPWNDALCAKVEHLTGGHRDGAKSTFRQKFGELWTGIRHSIIRLIIYLMGALVLLIAEWVTGAVATPIVAPLGILWSIVFVSLEFADIPESRRNKTLSEKFDTFKAHPAAMLGFGSVTYLILLIPVLNVLVIPFAVTGITLLYREQLES